MTQSQVEHALYRDMSRTALDVVDVLPDAEGLKGYASKMYSEGLARYVTGLEKIGFVGAQRVLDAGSGAGQWSVALALLNEHVVGVELRAEFVDLAQQIVRRLEMAGRVSFRIGRIEDQELAHERVELAVCHGVLMYTDHERALLSIARALVESGRLYCGYTDAGLRLLGATSLAAERRWGEMRSTLEMNLSAELYRVGIYQVLGGRVRALTAAELLRLGSLLGFEVIDDSPGIQDMRGEWLGLPLTYDFVARRTGSPEAREERLGSAGASDRSIECARGMIGAGAPAMALRVLEGWGTSPEVCAGRLAAMIKLGRVREAEPLLDHLPPQHAHSLRGRYWLQRRAFARAKHELSQIVEPDEDEKFLLATVLLVAGETAAAEALFSAQLRRDPLDLRALHGTLICALAQDHHRAALGVLVDFITSQLGSGCQSTLMPDVPESDPLVALERLHAVRSKIG